MQSASNPRATFLPGCRPILGLQVRAFGLQLEALGRQEIRITVSQYRYPTQVRVMLWHYFTWCCGLEQAVGESVRWLCWTENDVQLAISEMAHLNMVRVSDVVFRTVYIGT